MEDETLCHCGNKNMITTNHKHKGMFVWSLQFYCFECATCRCDTSAGMEAGCPNG